MHFGCCGMLPFPLFINVIFSSRAFHSSLVIYGPPSRHTDILRSRTAIISRQLLRTFYGSHLMKAVERCNQQCVGRPRLRFSHNDRRSTRMDAQ
jgi:hypothetical protein